MEPRLRAFAAVAREGSFSRAAAALYVSQPAVSKHVASLEAELGTPLVVRGRRGIALTPEGEVLADYVLRAEALLANARRALHAGGDAQTGTLALASSGIPGTYLLPDLLGRFREQHPNVEIDFRVQTSGEALELVRSHAVELAVVGGLDVPHELEAEPLMEDEVVVIGPPSLAGRRLRAKELGDLTWISREEGSSTRAATESARWQIGIHSVRELELPTWEAVKLAVASGTGVAAISRFALGVELEAGRVAVLDVPRWRVSRTIAVVRARDVPLTPPADRFVKLLREAFVPSDEPASPPNSNLRLPETVLFGREDEIAEVARLLQSGTRLVTLAGPAGAGKTRLALETAASLVDSYPDGVYFVDLAPVADASLVLATIAATLTVHDPQRLAERLSNARLLLVLDNFEHVVSAANEVKELLGGGTQVSILATSRTPLRLRSEHVVTVAPLSEGAAIDLFVDRARAAQADFEPDDSVAVLCERLDRLPLALELVAARTAQLPPAALIDGLHPLLAVLTGPRDVPARQRTLTAAIDWSYELLDAKGKRLFSRLGVFAGGCSARAARAVCGARRADLVTLVDQNLLRVEPDEGGPRYGMLETIREFATARLEERGESDQIRRRHAEFFAELAETARGYARGPRESEWMDRLAAENGNIRAALAFATEESAPELGLALAAALEPLWTRRGYHLEGLGWLEPLLLARGETPPEVVARALALAGRLAVESGQLERAEPWYEEALALTRSIGDRENEAWALHGLGHLTYERGDAERAAEYFESSLALFLELGMHGPAGGRLTYLAEIALDSQEFELARERLDRALEQYTIARDQLGVGGTIHSLGDLALRTGDLEQAAEHYREALELMRGAFVDYDAAYCLGGLAAVLAQQGRREEAGVLWGAADRIDRNTDVGMRPTDREEYERRLGELPESALETGRALGMDEAAEYALSVMRSRRPRARSRRRAGQTS